MRKIKGKTKISVVVSIALLISFLSIFLSPKIVKSQGSYIEITNCTTITQPGEYRLTQDIIDSDASTCINITADDVILDCQWHIIDGTNTPETYGIYIVRSNYSEKTNITIKNCIVTDWYYGMYLNIIYYSSFSNMILNSNFIGIYALSTRMTSFTNITSNYNSNIGIYLNGGGNTLTNITSNYNSIGLHCYFVTGSIIKDSIFQGNSNYGIYLENTGAPPGEIFQNQIYNNIFNNTNNFGTNSYYYYKNYLNTTLQPGNNIWNSSLGYIGGNLWTNPSNTGYSDTCVDNNFDGFCDQPYDLFGDGTNIDYLPLAKYVGQNAPTPPHAPPYTEVSSCMQITQPGEYRLVNDLQLGSYPFCLEILSNDVTLDCQGYKIQDYTSSSGTRGIYIRQYYSNVTIKNCDVRGFNGSGSIGIMFDGDNSYINILNSTLIDNNIYGGNLNTSYVTIDSVIIYNTGTNPGILAKFNDSLINYVYIESSGVNNSGIYVEGNNITVENSYIKNYSTGIFVHADYLFVYNNTIVKDNPNLEFNPAIRVMGSHNSKVSGNKIYGNNNDLGIWTCCPSNDNLTIDNNYIENTFYGIGDSSTNVYVFNNTIIVGAVGITFYYYNPYVSQYITIENNTITHKYGFGGYCIGFGNSTDNVVRYNTIIEENPNSGGILNEAFLLWAPVKNTTITDNIIKSDLLVMYHTSPSYYSVQDVVACRNNVEYNKSWNITIPYFISRGGSLVNVMRIESSTCTPYINYVFNYNNIDFGTVQPYQTYDAVGIVRIDSNMVNITFSVNGTDMVGPSVIPSTNIKFSPSKNLEYPTSLVPIESIVKYVFYYLPNEFNNIVENLFRFTVPLVSPGSYSMNVTIGVSV